MTQRRRRVKRHFGRPDDEHGGELPKRIHARVAQAADDRGVVTVASRLEHALRRRRNANVLFEHGLDGGGAVPRVGNVDGGAGAAHSRSLAPRRAISAAPAGVRPIGEGRM